MKKACCLCCWASVCLLLLLLTLATSQAAAADCADAGPPSRWDAIVSSTAANASNNALYGRANMADAVWHDDTWAFRRWGPLSRVTLYKAWFYDGAWHDPGEFKGIQAWHGRYYKTDDLLLFGAKRPHHPLNCTLYRHEVFVGAELQWDHVMRFMNFTTNRGRYCSWGFPNVTGTQVAVVQPPAPNAYIAALQGYEGKPLPPSLGGFKKRYIVQLGFVWAQPSCNSTSNATALVNASAGGGGQEPNATAGLPPVPIPSSSTAPTFAEPEAAAPAAAAAAAPAPLAPLATPVAIPVIPLDTVMMPPAAAQQPLAPAAAPSSSSQSLTVLNPAAAGGAAGTSRSRRRARPFSSS